jgi:DNA-binding LytR/AlgR family response regulator
MQSSSKLETILEHIAIIYQESFDIDVFYSKNKFYENFTKKYYDVVYIEIENENINESENKSLYIINKNNEIKKDSEINCFIDTGVGNGIEIGRWIRERLLNDRIQIIYMSSDEKYAIQSFKTRPMDFIIKPITFTNILDNIQIIKRLMKNQEDQFEFKVGYTSFKIPYDEIMYFENSSRKINIVTTRSINSFYGSIEKIKESSNTSNFIHIHKSYFVNMDYIIKYEYHQVTMKNGSVLPISQPNRKRIRSQRLYSENIY